MVKPQQPELARSGRGATSDDSAKGFLTAQEKGGGERGIGGRVPDDNLPGHHPAEEQDKPVEAFVQKAQQLAAGTDGEADVDLPAEEAGSTTSGETTSELAEKAAKAAGTPFKVAGTVLERLRDKL